MKNKAMLFSANGNMFKEVHHDELSLDCGWKLKVGAEGEISCIDNVAFIKIPLSRLEHYEKESEPKDLEVYIYDTLIFKGFGSYCESRHSAPYIIAKIEGDLFKVHIQGSLERHVSVLKNCLNHN